MTRLLVSSLALLAVAAVASPAFAQQLPPPGASGRAMVQDYDDRYRDDGYRDDRYRDDYRRDYRDERYAYDGHRGQVVRCESIDNRRNWCGTRGAREVALVNQLSDSSCVRNRSWGYSGRGIWVDRGCRAEFVVRR